MMTSSVPDYLKSLILHKVNSTGKEIGRGAYGRVFEVDYEGTLCAAKEVHALLLQLAMSGRFSKLLKQSILFHYLIELRVYIKMIYSFPMLSYSNKAAAQLT